MVSQVWLTSDVLQLRVLDLVTVKSDSSKPVGHVLCDESPSLSQQGLKQCFDSTSAVSVKNIFWMVG